MASKAKKEAEIEALRQCFQRLLDGANGGPPGDLSEYGDIAAACGLEIWLRWVNAIKWTAMLGLEKEARDQRATDFELWSLDHFTTVESAAEWMHERGMRVKPSI